MFNCFELETAILIRSLPYHFLLKISELLISLIAIKHLSISMTFFVLDEYRPALPFSDNAKSKRVRQCKPLLGSVFTILGLTSIFAMRINWSLITSNFNFF